jgi:imidazole glycerol-phosphate synthase subunit HisH
MTKEVTVIIDYKLGNLFSIKQACQFAGIDTIVSSEKKEILSAEALIFPGVGAFGDAVLNLNKLDLVFPIKEFVSTGKPLLGICLGMQLLFSESEEFGSFRGLDIIPGAIKKFPENYSGNKLKVPQIGWNKIYKPDSSELPWDEILCGIPENEFMYFVHSFYAEPKDKNHLLSLTNYSGIEYCSAVQKNNNIFGFQFHPEKSGEKGLEIYKNFKKIIENKSAK